MKLPQADKLFRKNRVAEPGQSRIIINGGCAEKC